MTDSRAASTAGTIPLARPMPAATSMPHAMTGQGMLLVCTIIGAAMWPRA